MGVHFRRQAPLGKYVLDFYCIKSKLAIEVDGDIHADRTAYDTERSEWLDSQKQIRILRVTNQDVLENVDGVMMYILQELEPPPPLPSPVKKIT